MFQCPPGLALTFIGERQIVMRIGVSRSQLDSRAISRDGIVDAIRFVEHVAQVEVRQRVTRIGLNRETVMLFGRNKILTVVIKRAEVDMRGRVVRLECAAP